jgi:pyridoxal 5'-phosphate synthase pdxT subunit
MRCGVLALQGDWAAHAEVLTQLGVETVLIRTSEQLETVDALVLPGGESTAMLRLMEPDHLAERITQRVRNGLPVLATCAGVILLAMATEPVQTTLALLNVDVERNAFGRQVHSRVAAVELTDELGEPATIEGVFIRAPRITRVGPEVRILGRLGSDPVLVRQGGIIAATFHPELTDDHRVHRLLVDEEARHGR